MDDFKLLNNIVCPACKQGLEYHKDEKCLICGNCRLKYRVENGLPLMLIDQALKL